nr:4'-phosphopantetheinyl transferase superfamily protein [Magnetospirillum sulfuroxidans]
MAAAVLTEECDVGVDVEWLGRDPDCLGLGRRFFAAAECAVLEAAPPQRLAHTFLSFWTLKEAYIKAIGKGLAQPLDSFAFTLEPLSIAFTDTLADDPAHWRFHQAQPNDQHLLALALRHPHPDRVQVELRAMDF